MERRRVGETMHDLLLVAVERAADAQAASATLIEQQQDALVAIHGTLERAEQRRRAYGNRQWDAGQRSQPG